MTPENLSFIISIEWWGRYQDLLKQALSPLTDDQLAFRLGQQRSAGEIAAHMVMARAWYLHGVMGEGDAVMEPLTHWGDAGDPPHSTAELLAAIDQTWALLTACMARWTEEDMRDTFFINWRGQNESRGWVVWHILEHEIHHGGELSFTLGSFGLAGVDI